MTYHEAKERLDWLLSEPGDLTQDTQEALSIALEAIEVCMYVRRWLGKEREG